MISTALLNSWAITIWRASCQGTLLVAVVGVICWLVPSIPARYQAWLWRLAVAKFAIVLIWQVPVELPLLPTNDTSVSSTVSSVALRAQTIDARQSPHHRPALISILFLIWIVVVGCQLILMLCSYCDVLRRRRACQPVRSGDFLKEFSERVAPFGFRKQPEFLETNGAGSPFVVGVLYPAVVIPSVTLSRLDSSERLVAISHELSHVRRGDLAWNLVTTIVRLPFFFHPFVWFADRQLKIVQEIAADELAIQHHHVDPIRYGRLLVSIVSKVGPTEILPAMSVGAVGSIVGLTRRLVAMRFMNHAPSRTAFGSLAILGLLVLLGIVPWRLVNSVSKASIHAKSDPVNSVRSTVSKADNSNNGDSAVASPHSAQLRSDDEEDQPRYTAKIKISRGKQGEASKVLNEPTVQYCGHAETRVSIDDTFCIDVAVNTDRRETRATHSISVKFITNPKSELPEVLFAPRIMTTDGLTATVIDTRDDGDELRVDATIDPILQQTTDIRKIVEYYVGVNR